MAITAVLFDLDDTLFDHSACTRAALADLRVRFAVLGRTPAALVEAEHRRLLEALHVRVLAGQLTVDDARNERFRRLLAFVGGTPDGASPIDVAAAYRAAYLAHWRPVEGAIDLLAALHGRVSVGVVTNNIASEQRQKIASCGFEPFLDAVVISEEAGVAKPDPRIFGVALEALGAAAGETAMIGDAWETDIAGACAARIRPIWFNRLGASSPDRRVTEILSLVPSSAVLSVLFPDFESRLSRRSRPEGSLAKAEAPSPGEL